METVAEERTLQAHQKLLLDVIKKQAGTLPEIAVKPKCFSIGI